jgi:CopG family nickel-responsive transcriptional regulator
MDRSLLERFDRRIAARGYENRSEALRDLVRADLARGHEQSGGEVVGTITLTVSRRHRPELTRLVDALDDGTLLCVQSVHVDARHGLEILVVRGRASSLGELCGRLGGARGVLGAELTLATLVPGSEELETHHGGGRTR